MTLQDTLAQIFVRLLPGGYAAGASPASELLSGLKGQEGGIAWLTKDCAEPTMARQAQRRSKSRANMPKAVPTNLSSTTAGFALFFSRQDRAVRQLCWGS